ncbi:MAG: glycosyltransferase family 2 protein [Flavobacteriales bacterium]|nr:glycosyltransferase family 2 protein [Flavobacteriales bacterium]
MPSRSYSIVIPARNEEKYIERLLDSIVALDYPKDKLEVFVVDGESDDKTAELVQDYCSRFPHIHLILNPDRVTPISLNMGIMASTTDVRIILGAHSEIHSDYIKECEKAFEVSNADCVGGIIDNVYENQTSASVGKAMSSRFGVGNAHFRTGTFEGFVDTVAFGAYKKEVFDTIGYFDEDLVRNQDDEFNYRLLASGRKIWLSSSIRCKYYVRASFKKLWKQYYQYGYWKVFVNKKHKAITTIRQLVPFFMVVYTLALLLGTMVYPNYVYLFSLPLFAYLLLGLSMSVSAGEGIAQKAQIWFTFFILHYGYGLGYLVGIFHFYLLGKKPSEKSKALSR